MLKNLNTIFKRPKTSVFAFSEYTNSNVMSFTAWYYLKNDNLPNIVFSFISKTNATNVRFFSLFESSLDTRIVNLYGSWIPFSDSLMLRMYNFMITLLAFKTVNYKCTHVFKLDIKVRSKSVVYHLDDPSYSAVELVELKKWELSNIHRNVKPIIICTNRYTQEYLLKNLFLAQIFVVEQGYFSVKSDTESNKFLPFSCVYSSPYIHYGSDKHAAHGTWGADLLIKTIIPRISIKDCDINFYLIGEIGFDAQKALNQFSNVHCLGRVNLFENMRIISKCSIGLYPRNIDYKRSMSKIFSYIGAGIPVVTFDLIDTEIIKLENLGLVAHDVDDFVDCVTKLKNNKKLYKEINQRILKIKNEYLWSTLTGKMSEFLRLNID